MAEAQLRCPLCGYTGVMFKPAGSIKTASGRRKLRACPNCDCDEWTRLAVSWLGGRNRLPRQSRVLTLTAPIALRRHLADMPGVSLVDAATADLAAGVFASSAFDLVVIGENWSFESNDISIAIKLLDALKERGWLIAMPRDEADVSHKTKQLAQLGFEPDAAEGLDRDSIAVASDLPFIAARKQAAKPVETKPQADADNRLIWYREESITMAIRPAPLARDWMDATTEKYAYRCLPLNIANCSGWELLSPQGFTATWSGDNNASGITIQHDDPAARIAAVSHFGFGVITFSIPGLLRTPPGIDLMVAGPINRPKPGIQALTGVIETDWSEFGFTMNWLFTDKNRQVRFEKDEPICTLIPMPRTLAEDLEPAIIEGDPDSDLWRRHMAHRLSRADFIKELKVKGSLAQGKGWQRTYFSGPQHEVAPEHRTKARLKPFKKMSD